MFWLCFGSAVDDIVTGESWVREKGKQDLKPLRPPATLSLGTLDSRRSCWLYSWRLVVGVLAVLWERGGRYRYRGIVGKREGENKTQNSRETI